MKKCIGHRTKWFRFDLPVMQDDVQVAKLTIEGFGCMKNGYANADIDSVVQGHEEIKPALEMFGGMDAIDAAAEKHVKTLFEEPVEAL